MLADWRAFLISAGARLEGDLVRDFGNPEREPEVNVITDLSFLSSVRIAGADATPFLHGQFSSEIAQLAAGAVQCSAWCNPKGQVIANFIIAKLDREFLLLLPRELKAALLKRLRLYVLRAAVSITEGDDTLACLGLRQSASSLEPFAPLCTVSENGLICLPVPGSRQRLILIGEVPALKSRWRQLAQHCTAVGTHCWHLFDILDGLPWITTATSETCMPQSLNLDLLGGLSYQKGCFPGQEIIARLHYRGQNKQRLFIANLETISPVLPGTKVYTHGTKPLHVGTIINASMHPAQGHYALVILDTDHGDAGRLRLEESSARIMRVMPPPYAAST